VRVTSFALAFALVLLVLVGGLVGLVRRRREPMGTPEQLERARQRNLEIEERERREDGAK
jgi:hypothetical protein